MFGTKSPWVSALVRWAPPVLWMGVIFRFSAIPGSKIPGRFSSLGHFAVYGVLGALLLAAFAARRDIPTAIALAVFVAALYGITDEFHQSFVPMRTPDVADWGVDTLGAFSGALAVTLARRRLTGRARQ